MNILFWLHLLDTTSVFVRKHDPFWKGFFFFFNEKKRACYNTFKRQIICASFHFISTLEGEKNGNYGRQFQYLSFETILIAYLRGSHVI